VATGLGAFPVWALGTRARGLQPALEGVAAGIMAVAAIAGLLLPAIDDGSAAQVAGGLVAGLGFLILTRRWLLDRTSQVGRLQGSGVRGARDAAQNVPEGTATAIPMAEAGFSRTNPAIPPVPRRGPRDLEPQAQHTRLKPPSAEQRPGSLHTPREPRASATKRCPTGETFVS
jgi:hypothetical protein